MVSATSEVKVDNGTADAAVGVAKLSAIDPTSYNSDFDSSSVENLRFKLSSSRAVSTVTLLPVAPGMVTVGVDAGFIIDARPLEEDVVVSSAGAVERFEVALVLSSMDVSTSEDRGVLDPDVKAAGGESLTAESDCGLIQDAREPVGGLGGGEASCADFEVDAR